MGGIFLTLGRASIAAIGRFGDLKMAQFRQYGAIIPVMFRNSKHCVSGHPPTPLPRLAMPVRRFRIANAVFHSLTHGSAAKPLQRGQA